MKKYLFLLLFAIAGYGQVSTGEEQEFDYGIKNNSVQTVTSPTHLTTTGTDGTQGKVLAANFKDVLEYASAVNLPVTGTAGKIYITTDDNKQYRWDGSVYLALSSGGGDTTTITGLPYNSNLYTSEVYLYGDSITTGYGAAPQSVYAWNSILPQKLGSTTTNYAIGGTTLVYLYAGDKSGIERLTEITPLYDSNKRAYISGIGVNDIGEGHGAYNSTNFRNAYYQLIDRLMVNQGWTADKIFLFVPLTSQPTGGALDVLVQDIAAVKGVNFIPVRDAMQNNGGGALLTDGLHPNNEGNKIIAETISDFISGAKHNYTQFHQDISTTGNLTVGKGITGGSVSNGLELRGFVPLDGNDVSKITAFSNFDFKKNVAINGEFSNYKSMFFRGNTGASSSPYGIDFGSDSYATGASSWNSAYLKFYNQGGTGTYIGVTGAEGLTIASSAGGEKITLKGNLITEGNSQVNGNITTNNNIVTGQVYAGPTTTPVFFSSGSDSYVNVAADPTNTSFRGYHGSGMSFGSVDGVAIVTNGLPDIISLKNNAKVFGNLEVTGNSNFIGNGSFGANLSGAQSTPTFLDLGSSYANAPTTSSNLKLKVWTGSGIGLEGTNGMTLLSAAGANGGTITSLNSHAFASSVYIANTPTTSSSSYEFLTRNTSTGVVEKINTDIALTGTPTAPTATLGTNTTQIATTAFVLANSGGSVNTSFTPVTYSLTISRSHDQDNPNIEITLSGNLNLTVTGTTNGDSGMVNIYSSASETIVINGLKGLNLTGNGTTQMIPTYFVHSTDGIRWYDGREAIEGSVDISNLAESVGTTLWHSSVATSAGTVSSSGTNWTGTGTALTNQMVGAKLFIGSEFLIILTVNTGAQTFTTTTALPVNVANSAFEIKLISQNNITGTVRYFDANEGYERGSFEPNGDVVFNSFRMRGNGQVVSNASLFVQDQVEIYGNNVKAPLLTNRFVYTVSTLPTPSSTERTYASVTDANNPTTGQLVVGGGTTKAPVYWNGTNWIAMTGGASGPIDAVPTDGSTNAVQSNGVSDALAGKANISGGTLFLGEVEAPSFRSPGGLALTSTGSGLFAPSNGGATFTVNHPDTPGWTSNVPITAPNIPVQLKDFYADSNNTSITETDLYSYLIAGNRITATGQKIVSTYAGTFNDVTASSQLKVDFAGILIGDTGALTMSVTGAWVINVSIVRTGASTARSIVNISTPGASTAAYTKYTSLSGLDFTTNNIIKTTGTAGGATGDSNDITATYGNIIWQPAAQ